MEQAWSHEVDAGGGWTLGVADHGALATVRIEAEDASAQVSVSVAQFTALCASFLNRRPEVRPRMAEVVVRYYGGKRFVVNLGGDGGGYEVGSFRLPGEAIAEAARVAEVLGVRQVRIDRQGDSGWYTAGVVELPAEFGPTDDHARLRELEMERSMLGILLGRPS